MDAVLQDLRYAWRSLRRQPAFALLAIGTLALGIGANAAIFSAVNAVLLRPLDYRQPDRIVALTNQWLKTGRRGTVSAPDFHDWHDSTKSFAAMGYYTYSSDFETSVSVDGVADYGAVVLVTPEFFDVFGVDALVGRHIARNAAPGDAPAAVLSHEFWLRRFGGAPNVIGRTVSFEERAVTIIGVMPPGFGFPGRTDIWYYPDGSPETSSRSAHNYRVVARLKDDASVEQAQAELSALAARLSAAYPASNEGKGAAVVPLREQLVGDTRPTLYMLFGAVALVLLIACANVANLLLARATGRTSELAVRAALGAGRGRIVGQLMIESLVLAAVSAAVGLGLARWGVAAFVALAPAGLPRAAEIGIDGACPRLHARGVGRGEPAVRHAAGGAGVARRSQRIAAPGRTRRGGQRRRAIPRRAGRRRSRARGRARRRRVAAGAQLHCARPRRARLRERSRARGADDGAGERSRRRTARDQHLRDAAATPRGAAGRQSTVAGVRGLPGTDDALERRLLARRRARPGGRRRHRAAGGLHRRHAGLLPHDDDSGEPRAATSADGDGDEAPMVAIVNEALARQAFPGVDPIGRKIMCGLDSPEVHDHRRRRRQRARIRSFGRAAARALHAVPAASASTDRR